MIYASMAGMSSNYECPSENFGDSSQLTNWFLCSGATCHMAPEVSYFIPVTLEDMVRRRTFQQVTHKGGGSTINYIKRFQNAHASSVSVGTDILKTNLCTHFWITFIKVEILSSNSKTPGRIEKRIKIY